MIVLARRFSPLLLLVAVGCGVIVWSPGPAGCNWRTVSEACGLTWDMKIMKVAGGKCKPGKMFLACDDFSEAVLFAFSSAVLGASRSFFDVDPEW